MTVVTLGPIVSCRGEAHPYTNCTLCINHHAGTPDKTKTKVRMSLDYDLLHCSSGSGIRIGVDEGNLKVMDVEMIIRLFSIHTYGTYILASSSYSIYQYDV